jgi:hypothetical protein
MKCLNLCEKFYATFNFQYFDNLEIELQNISLCVIVTDGCNGEHSFF